MLAAMGEAKPDHLDALFGVIERVLAAIAGDICALCIEELGRGLGTTSGEEQERDEGFHARSLVGIG